MAYPILPASRPRRRQVPLRHEGRMRRLRLHPRQSVRDRQNSDGASSQLSSVSGGSSPRHGDAHSPNQVPNRAANKVEGSVCTAMIFGPTTR